MGWKVRQWRRSSFFRSVYRVTGVRHSAVESVELKSVCGLESAYLELFMEVTGECEGDHAGEVA